MSSSTWTRSADMDRVKEVVEQQCGAGSDPSAFPLFIAQKQGHPDYLWLFDAQHPMHQAYLNELRAAQQGAEARQKRNRDEEGEDSGSASSSLLSQKGAREARAFLFQPFSLYVPSDAKDSAAEENDNLPTHRGPHRPYPLSTVDHRLWTSLLYACPEGGAHFSDCIQFALGRVTKTEYLLEALCHVVSFEEKKVLSAQDADSSQKSRKLVSSLFFLVSSLFAEYEQGTASRQLPIPPYRPVFTHYVPRLVSATVGVLQSGPAPDEESLGYLEGVLEGWKEATLFPEPLIDEWMQSINPDGKKEETAAQLPTEDAVPAQSAAAKSRAEEYEAV